MAKVTGPLFSLSAKGKIMDALVYFPWKAIDCVRAYVIPANPNTSAQQTQRSHFKDAVDKWHDTSWIDDDKTAWDLYATTLAEIMSGFNAFIRSFLEVVLAGDTWHKLYNATLNRVSATATDVIFDTDETNACTLHWGTSPTFMPNSDSQTPSSGQVLLHMTGLTEGVTYYYYCEDGNSTKKSRTGVYKFTKSSST